MTDSIIYIIFAFWFLVSVYSQPRGGIFEILRRYDIFSLLPTWTFFAPIPATSDTHIVYRDRLSDNSFTEWTEVRGAELRRPWHMLWNPHQIREKALLDAIHTLSHELAAAIRHTGDVKVNPAFIQISSIGYLTILNHISSLERLFGTEDTQFAIIRTHATHHHSLDREGRVMFVSSLHQLA